MMEPMTARFLSMAALAALAGFAASPGLADDAVLAGECLPSVRHIPVEDVAYRAGVDVNGNAVVPADLTPTIGVPDFTEPIDFALVINPVEEAGLDFPAPTGAPRFEDTTAFVGEVSIVPATGVTQFNGRALASPSPCLPRAKGN